MCSVCGVGAALTMNGTPVGFCADCLGAQLSEWSAHSQVRGWESRIKAQYGLTAGEHAELFANQGGLCAICRDPQRSSKKEGIGLVIDHDHDSGEVRGLLCAQCNAGLGLFRDRSAWLEEARRCLANTDTARRKREERRVRRSMRNEEHIARRLAGSD